MRRCHWTFSLLQLPIFILLIWFGCPYRPTWVTWLKPSVESGRFGINLEEIDMAYEPLPEQIALGLNAPPALIGELMDMPIYYATRIYFTGAQRELISHTFTALIIPFFWIWVMRTTAAPRRSPRKLTVIIRISILIGIVLLLISAILTLGQIYMPSGHYSIVRDIFFLAWFLWGICILTIKLIKKPPSESATKASIGVNN